MRSHWLAAGLVVTIALFATVLAPLGLSQGRNGPTARGPAHIGDGVPEAALLTERGRQLAEQLRRLQRSEASLGPRHPALPGVREEIARVQEQLQAWLPEPQDEQPIANQVPEMNDDDLRQLLLRMSVKVQRLEQRVEALEKRLEVF